jgi:hypothetical protein
VGARRLPSLLALEIQELRRTATHLGRIAIELDEEQAITVGQLDAAAYFALQYDHLLPERDASAAASRAGRS